MIQGEDITLSAKLMENIYPSYVEMKQIEHKLKGLNSYARNLLKDSEMRVHNFCDGRVIAEFVRDNEYETDYVGLNEYLYYKGLLVLTNKLDDSILPMDTIHLESYKLPKTYFIRPNLNKLGKVKKEDFEGFGTLDFELDYFCTHKEIYDSLEKSYERTKSLILECPVLREKRKVLFKYGSLSLIKNKQLYNVQQLFNDGQIDLLINYSRPSSEKLEELMLNGSIQQKEIKQFKKLVDVKLKFVLTTPDSKERMRKAFDWKLQRMSANL
ncbi:hypothetical protein [Bacillus cereus]|uniref:hypothetical protein n=1 Tax=Bacillus cereus TaxID=1396 RepID=UPI00187AD28A|nr:hypothetical protein [Bacillus cereus]MBE7123433.1 hypothetical protein [Bacillus cereus]